MKTCFREEGRRNVYKDTIKQCCFPCHILFSKNESQAKCMRPCKSVRYPFSLLKYHKSGKVLLQGIETNGAFLLLFGYDDLVMDKKKEYLVMDRGGLISTVGGFLGLFLGSSCVSIIEWLANQTKGYIKV